MSKEIKELEAWLKKPDNTSAMLAAKLGYKSSTIVQHWIRRGNLPHMRVKEILKLIRK